MDQAAYILVQHAQLEYYTNVGDFSDGLRFRLDKSFYIVMPELHDPTTHSQDTAPSANFDFKKREIKPFDHRFNIPHDLLWSVGQAQGMNHGVVYLIAEIVAKGTDWSLLGLSAEIVYSAVTKIMFSQGNVVGALSKYDKSESVYSIEPEGVGELPAMGMMAHCPECEGSSPLSLKRIVMHLNDHHQWSREDIADWLDIWADSNDVDISF